MTIPTKTEAIDLFWRSVWTFVQVSTGILTGDQIRMMLEDESSRIPILRIALYAGIGAVYSLIKTYASNKNGTGTATSRSEPAIGLQPVASDSATPAQ